MVEEASGASPGEFVLVLGDPVMVGARSRFHAMVERRCTGEPLQYVLGHWGFRSLDLMVDGRVLIPRPETESVVEVALGELDRMGGREIATTVVDLGTGSGAIALSMATERVRTKVWATDADGAALEVARANLVGVGRSAARVTMVTGNWYGALPRDLRGSIQLIVSNPPYVPETANLPADVMDWEPKGALFAGGDGLDDLRRIIVEAPEWLEADGALVCEISPEQADEVCGIAEAHFEESRTEPDLVGRARALVARRPIR